MNQPRPTTAKCVVCGDEFTHPVRLQGGGRRSKYCGTKCRQIAWLDGNPEKRQAIITRYDTKPENRENKRQRALKDNLRKHGWTVEQFNAQLRRQGQACYGCLNLFDGIDVRPCVDHDHKTNKVRGILCNNCNWALGHVQDNPMTLRRLISYLDYQREKVCVYLAGALKNSRIPIIGNELRAAGLDVMDEWITPGEHADESWQDYERIRGRSYSQALRGRAATNVFMFDRAYIDLSDVVVVVLPAGKSAMLELGYAKGRGKRTVLFLDETEPERFDIMPSAADEIVTTLSELIALLTAWSQ